MAARRVLSLLTFMLMVLGLNATGWAATLDSVFRDTETHWSRQHVERMNAKGLVNGVQRADGLYFEPDRSITRWEAIALIIRALGIDAKALSQSRIPATFLEADTVPAWATGYIAEAVKRGIIAGSELTQFKGGQPATRLQVAGWLSRSLGLPEPAALGLTVTFKDLGNLTKGDRQYILKVADAGLMGGYLGEFRPGESVTRAEIATVLSRADQLLENSLDKKEFSGTLKSAKDNLVVKLSDGSDKVFGLDESARVYIEGIRAGISTLLPGDHVTVIEDGAGTAVYIEATNRASEVRGTLSWVGFAGGVNSSDQRSVDVRQANGQVKRHKLDAGTVILINGLPGGFSWLKPGQQVVLEDRANRILRVRATSQMREIRGTVGAVAISSDGSAILTLEVYNEKQVFTLPMDLQVIRNGERVSFTSVRSTDLARLVIHDDTITRAEFQSKERTLGGTLKAISFAKPVRLIISLDEESRWGAQNMTGEPEATLQVADSVKIKKDGRTAGLTALQVGDDVKVDIEGDKVVYVKANTVAQETRGVIQKVTIAQNAEITITLTNGEIRTLVVASDVDITVGGKPAALTDLKPGQEVTVNLSGERVVAIAASSNILLDDIRGTVRYVDSKEGRFVVEQADGTTRQVSQGKNFIVIKNGELKDRLRDVHEGDVVIVAGRNVVGLPFVAEAVLILGSTEE